MYIATAHEEEKSAAEENLQDMWTQDVTHTGHWTLIVNVNYM